MFTHLHVHTKHSLLDGMTDIRQLVRKVKADGQTACAITDHGTCSGLVKFYTECMKENIKPILGCEFYEAPLARQETGNDKPYYHLVLLVKNDEGYRNLCFLSARAHTERFYRKPRIDRELLSEHHEGLICLSGCIAGRISQDILSGDIDKARADLTWYKGTFGGDFYLEIQNHGLSEEKTVSSVMINLAKESGIKLVCTNDCHYLDRDDAEAHEYLLCMQTDKKITEEHMKYHGDYSVKTEEEMRKLFPEIPEVFDNTMEVAGKCNFRFRFAEKPEDYLMPDVDVPERFKDDHFDYLSELAWQGFEKRYPKDTMDEQFLKKASDRLMYELLVVKKMGFSDYFLDIRATISKVREKNILVGPGRGSGAGSVLNYCIGITDICPLKYGLKFERFLNPERVSMPDIDTDFCEMFRDEIIRMESERVGPSQFCKINTLMGMKAKSIIRDVIRVADLPLALGTKITKMFPDTDENGKEVTLQAAYKLNQQLSQLIDSDAKNRMVWQIACRLEGGYKSSSTHACGHIALPRPCEECFPCRLDRETGYMVCEYDMSEVEHLGFLKKDLLMLRNLSIIANAREAVKRNYGVDAPLWTDEVLNDKAALQLFHTGDTYGIFQFESQGMTSFMQELKPTDFENIIAGVSLYRPGPMDYIPKYIEGKRNPDDVQYDCPELVPILRSTYGVIVYQEQVMQIVQELAGFSMGRADLIRKAMGKKKQDIIDAERKNFVYGNEELDIDGCIKRGIPEEIAQKIYDDMAEFAKYAFNKSHAACYAAISMVTAWYKAHYPYEYMAAILSSVSAEKLSFYVTSVRDHGYDISKPDINASMYAFTTRSNSIIYGLGSIKSVGKAAQLIIDERLQHGEYTSFEDMIRRTGINKKVVESLIYAGACDRFGYTRAALLSAMEGIIDGFRMENKKNIEGQMSLFDLFEVPRERVIPYVAELEKHELLVKEKEYVGTYFSGHPFDEYKQLMVKGLTYSTAFLPESSFDESVIEKLFPDKRIKVMGTVSELEEWYTKEQKPMCRFFVEDSYGRIPCICFPKAYNELRISLSEGQGLFINGKVMEDSKGEGFILCIEQVYDLLSLKTTTWLRFADMEQFKQVEGKLMAIPFKEGKGTLTATVSGRFKHLRTGIYALGRYDELYCLCGRSNVATVPEFI